MKKITLLTLALITGFIANAQDVVVDQINDAATVGLIISFQGNDNNGVYISDDFEITESTILGEMDFEGNLSNVANFTNLLGFNIFIYEDDNGLPSGDPSQLGTGLIELVNIPPSMFTLEEDGIGNANFRAIQITEANGGNQITLEPGTYWISAFPTVNEPYANAGMNRWNWAGSTPDVSAPIEPLLIDPFDNFGAGATSWANIAGLIGAPFPGTVFQIRSEESLSVDSNTLSERISLFPNPTNGDLSIELGRDFGATSVTIINVSGQNVLTSEVNSFGTTVLQTTALATGVYFAQVVTEQGATTIKFVKN